MLGCSSARISPSFDNQLTTLLSDANRMQRDTISQHFRPLSRALPSSVLTTTQQWLTRQVDTMVLQVEST